MPLIKMAEELAPYIHIVKIMNYEIENVYSSKQSWALHTRESVRAYWYARLPLNDFLISTEYGGNKAPWTMIKWITQQLTTQRQQKWL